MYLSSIEITEMLLLTRIAAIPAFGPSRLSTQIYWGRILSLCHTFHRSICTAIT